MEYELNITEVTRQLDLANSKNTHKQVFKESNIMSEHFSRKGLDYTLSLSCVRTMLDGFNSKHDNLIVIEKCKTSLPPGLSQPLIKLPTAHMLKL